MHTLAILGLGGVGRAVLEQAERIRNMEISWFKI